MMWLALLVGCGSEPDEVYDQFKDVYKPTLVVNAGDSPPRGEHLQVLVHPELAGVCRALPKLSASVDGVALTRLHGKAKGGNFEYDRDCYVYEFEAGAEQLAKRTPGEESVVTVTDGVTTLSTKVRHLFAARTLTPTAPEYAAGSEVVLAWAPGGDVVDPKVAYSVQLTDAAGQGTRVSPVAVTATDVRFTLPAGLTGEVTVDFYGSKGLQPAELACEGPVKCEVSRAFIVPTVKLSVK